MLHAEAADQGRLVVESGRTDTHSKVIGYILWIFGFMGAHRVYYGRPVTGTI